MQLEVGAESWNLLQARDVGKREASAAAEASEAWWCFALRHGVPSAALSSGLSATRLAAKIARGRNRRALLGSMTDVNVTVTSRVGLLFPTGHSAIWHSIWRSIWHSIWHSHLTFYLAFSSDILSGTLSDVLSGILIWHSIWHSHLTFYLAFYLAFHIWHSYLTFYLAFYLAFHLAFSSGILIWHSHLAFFSGILSGTLIWRSIWHSIWHSYLAFHLAFLSGILSGGWGPAGNTGRGFSRLRSGREHWAWMVVVEVRQGTLGVDGRGWGPEKAEEAEGGGRRPKSTDIKSNNPHLAGGELNVVSLVDGHDPSEKDESSNQPYPIEDRLNWLVVITRSTERCSSQVDTLPIIPTGWTSKISDWKKNTRQQSDQHKPSYTRYVCYWWLFSLVLAPYFTIKPFIDHHWNYQPINYSCYAQAM